MLDERPPEVSTSSLKAAEVIKEVYLCMMKNMLEMHSTTSRIQVFQTIYVIRAFS